MAWTLVFVVAGAVAPLIVGMAAVYLRTRNVPGAGGLVRAFYLGLALGAAGGAAVSALLLAAVLLLRLARD